MLEISRIKKSIETKNGLVISGDWGWEKGDCLEGIEFSLGKIKKKMFWNLTEVVFVNIVIVWNTTVS
jgi:hypothetical protein